jgi:hypothetical protein
MIPRPARSLACALLMASLTLPSPASAYRDCWSVRSIPPRLVGVSFNGPTDKMLGRLERAGFQDFDPVSAQIAGLGILTNTPVLTHGLPPEPGSISSGMFAPSIARSELTCGPPRDMTPMPMGGHPNGARMLRTVIAVVADLDRSCASLGGPAVRSFPLAFGPAYDDPTLGARVREARIDLGGVRLIAPTDPAGPAARWLANGGPRWIGFAVEVGNLEDTERWLRREGVDYDVTPRAARCCLRVGPEVLDGLLVEFVSKRDQGDSGNCDTGPRF